MQNSLVCRGLSQFFNEHVSTMLIKQKERGIYTGICALTIEMPLGLRSDYRINSGDTAELHATLYDESELAVAAADILEVRFTIQKPDKSQYTAGGQVLDSGVGFVRVDDTADLGPYNWVAQFTLTTGQIRSERGNFDVFDPFNPPEPTPEEALVDSVWMKLEDCFDSEEGGPWLRDMTLAYFDKRKIPEFFGDAILDINLQPPETHVSIGEFLVELPDGTPDPDMPLAAQGVLLAVIRHLMRAYVEQPLPTGAQVVYEDRRDYLQRWQTIYQIELERYTRWLALWKRKYVGLGKSKLLVGAKAGRMLPAPLRTRNIGRGYM